MAAHAFLSSSKGKQQKTPALAPVAGESVAVNGSYFSGGAGAATALEGVTMNEDSSREYFLLREQIAALTWERDSLKCDVAQLRKENHLLEYEIKKLLRLPAVQEWLIADSREKVSRDNPSF
jgi:hypothetical protein